MVKTLHLTRKRKKWLGTRTTLLKGKPLHHCIGIQDKYAKKLSKLVDIMTTDVTRQVIRLFTSPESQVYFTTDASLGSQGKILINKLNHKYFKLFAQLSKPYATQMVTEVDRFGQASLYESVKKLTGGAQIKTHFINDTLKSQIAAGIAVNVGLIKSIPRQYLDYVGGAVMRSIIQPDQGGITELKQHIHGLLNARNKGIHNKARNTAYDQTRKMYNHLNATRMDAIGLNKYQWLHSGAGQRPREYHMKVLNGQIFSLDDPPIVEEATGERGIPGTAINCRCTMLPLLEFSDGQKI